ncbi:hypothetical protein Mapa_011354 [Marchantia paleacea]|nr:hypothetical protein Mapa_011354 [Marchantia paleacea]
MFLVAKHLYKSWSLSETMKALRGVCSELKKRMCHLVLSYFRVNDHSPQETEIDGSTTAIDAFLPGGLDKTTDQFKSPVPTFRLLI